MNAVDALKRHIDELEHQEKIDGRSPRDFANMVLLEVEFSPVVPLRVADVFTVPESVKVDKWEDGRYAIVYPDRHDFEVVQEEILKVMRARFLLLRGWYYRKFDFLSHSTQQKVLANFFPEGMVRWSPDSELGKLMTGS